jgi:plasmid stabilization system protein ParE
VKLLARSPRMGVRRPEIAPSARMPVEGVHLILYETHPETDEGPLETIEIVRIVHGHRDLSRIFQCGTPLSAWPNLASASPGSLPSDTKGG